MKLFSPADSLTQYRFWLICICAGMLLFFTQVTVLFPVLPVYVTQRWGASAPVGLVVGALAAGLLLFRPWIGLLIDRWGRKPVLWLGLLIMICILPLYSWSPTPGWLMAVRILHGISQAAFATASQTLLADLVPAERRTAMMGYLAMSNTIGFSLGPLLGSVLFAASGFTTVLLVMAGLTALGFAISLPLPWLKTMRSAPINSAPINSAPLNSASINSAPISPASSAESALPQAIGFPWKPILSFPVRDATLFFFIGSFLHGGVVTFLPLFVPNSAAFYTINALTAVLIRFAMGRWGHLLSQRWIISLSLFCSGSAVLGLSLFPQGLVGWSILYGLGFGALFPVLSAIVSLSAAAAVRGRVYSVFLAGFDAGMTLGGAGGQPLMQVMSLGSLFTVLGSIGCGASWFAFRRFNRSLPPVENA
ncbi:MAG TPA: MFS transporter [Allocoleopsis sp.]